MKTAEEWHYEQYGWYPDDGADDEVVLTMADIRAIQADARRAALEEAAQAADKATAEVASVKVMAAESCHDVEFAKNLLQAFAVRIRALMPEEDDA